MNRTVLLIDDDDVLRASIAQTIDLGGMTPIQASSLSQARRTIRANFSGVVLSDIRMPRQDGFDVLSFAQNIDKELPVILLTGHSDVPTAMRSIKQGAYEYLEKPCNTEKLIDVLNRALDHRELVLKSRRIEQALLRNDAAAMSFPGSSDVTAAFRKSLRQADESGNHIHLYGPKGVGKKQAAYVINQIATEPRPFITVNFRTAPIDALESIELPDGMIDLSCQLIDMSTTAQQQKLADLLETRPSLRLITSSNFPLSHMSEDALADRTRWSEKAIEINIPTLKERREDLPEIFESVLRMAVRNLDCDMPDIPSHVITEVLMKSWEGNLPELRSYANAFAMGAHIGFETGKDKTLAEQLDEFERMVLIETLKQTNGKATEAANALGIPRNTLYDRLARYGISAKDFRSL